MRLISTFKDQSARFSTSRIFIPAAIALVAAAAFATPTPATAASCQGAKSFAGKIGKKITNIVANGSISSTARLRKFRSVFKRNADFPSMGRFALGRYWKKLAAGDRKSYYRLVESLVVGSLFGRLNEYAGNRYSIAVDNCRPKGTKGNQFIVQGPITNAAGQVTTQVHWWLLAKGGGYKVFDIQIAGVWLTQQKRDEFTSFVKSNGANVKNLLADLKRRTSI
ncbi:MAG: MlaC/ttg2D family ABC transporter substrate-binding protein [Alphaproteobacteria bacterium]